jgi:hypothetical protein
MTSSSHWSAHRSIDAHFRGATSPARERRMRAHLAGCAGCRERYERHLHLAALVPDAAAPARERLRRGLGLDAPAAASRASFAWWRGAAPALAALCLVVAFGLRRPSPSEPQARGGAGPASHLLAYELAPGHAARQALGAIDRGSGLAFAYVNGARRARLLVFGVDESRRVYWYHPAWVDARENPVAVPIEGDDRLHEIPQAVTQALASKRLEIFGAFGDDTLSVRDVEAAVARAPLDEQGRPRVTLPGWDVTRLDLSLTGAP